MSLLLGAAVQHFRNTADKTGASPSTVASTRRILATAPVADHAPDEIGHVQRARRRRMMRTVRSSLLRLRRAAVVLVSIVALLLLYSAFVSAIGLLEWILALSAACLTAALSLFWPIKRPKYLQSRQGSDLRAMAERSETMLLENFSHFPIGAAPVINSILGRLIDLPRLALDIPKDHALTAEAECLIGRYLPDLVRGFISLAPSARHARENKIFIDSLATISKELERLSAEIAGIKTYNFEVQRRFIETRFGENDDLSI